MAGDFMALARKTSIPTPNLDRLYPQIDPAAQEIPAGSAQIPMDWRAIWAILIVKVGVFLGMVWLLKRRRKTT